MVLQKVLAFSSYNGFLEAFNEAIISAKAAAIQTTIEITKAKRL